MQTTWNCKHDMKMPCCWQIGGKLIHPLHSFYVLTFWAITVSTRVVRLHLIIAVIAIQSMATQLGCSASYNIIKCFLLYCAERMMICYVVFVMAENVSNFYGLLFIFHSQYKSIQVYHIQWRSKLIGFYMCYVQIYSCGFK